MPQMFKPGDIVIHNRLKNVFSCYSVYLVISTRDTHFNTVPLFRPDIGSFILQPTNRKDPKRISFESSSVFPKHSISNELLRSLLDGEFRFDNTIQVTTFHRDVLENISLLTSTDQFLPHAHFLKDFALKHQYKNISDADIQVLQNLLFQSVLYKILLPPQIVSLPTTTL